VPTLTRLDHHRIVCKTIAEERQIGVILAGVGMFLAIFAVYGSARGPSDWASLLVLVAYLLGMLAATWAGLFRYGGLKNEWLAIDLGRRRYKGRRGLFFWAETLRGPLDDLERVRLVEIPADPQTGRFFWVFEFVWLEDRHRPFRVNYWSRPRSFHLESCRGYLDSRSLLRTLKEMSRCTGLPLEIPKKYLDSLGLFDFEIDAL
jgi:hypothetical protein